MIHNAKWIRSQIDITKSDIKEDKKNLLKLKEDLWIYRLLLLRELIKSILKKRPKS